MPSDSVKDLLKGREQKWEGVQLKVNWIQLLNLSSCVTLVSKALVTSKGHRIRKPPYSWNERWALMLSFLLNCF